MNRMYAPCALPFVLFLSGCSVAMALNGHQEPNFEAFEVGSQRKQVEIQLGPPISSQTLTDGKRMDTYQFEMGNSPNGHRAMMNLYIDLATLGLWELPATIIEAMMGHMEATQVVYGIDDRVLEIKGYQPPPISAALKAAREQQQKAQPPVSKTEPDSAASPAEK